ncbi:hypothetical protein L209DRAFT_614396 [Thermothelomyces heterothallicus CBS 203.75]
MPSPPRGSCQYVGRASVTPRPHLQILLLKAQRTVVVYARRGPLETETKDDGGDAAPCVPGAEFLELGFCTPWPRHSHALHDALGILFRYSGCLDRHRAVGHLALLPWYRQRRVRLGRERHGALAGLGGVRTAIGQAPKPPHDVTAFSARVEGISTTCHIVNRRGRIHGQC